MSSLAEIKKLSDRAEKRVLDVTRLIAKVHGDGFKSEELSDIGAPTMKDLASAVTVARALSPVTLGNLATALTPLATALVTFGKELSGTAGRAAAAAACSSEGCRRSLFQLLNYFGACFAAWEKLLGGMRLTSARPGDLPKGSLKALYAPIPFPPAVMPVLLAALGDMKPSELSIGSKRAVSYAMTLGNAIYLLQSACTAVVLVSESYSFHSSYQREFDTLVGSEGLSNANLHETVWPWAIETVLTVAAADAAAAADTEPPMPDIRAKIKGARICAQFLYLLGMYVGTMRESADDRPGYGAVVGRRMARLMGVPDFARAFIAAIETSYVASGDVIDREIVAQSTGGAYVFFLYFMNLKSIDTSMRWPARCQGNRNVLLSRSTTWDRLLVASRSFAATAVAPGGNLTADDREGALGAALLMPLFTISASIAEYNADSSSPLDLRFIVKALDTLAAAWNADWATWQPSPDLNIQFECSSCACLYEVLNRLCNVRMVDTTAAKATGASPAALRASLQTTIDAVDGLACMAGSIFVTLDAHVTHGHASGGGLMVSGAPCDVLKLAALMPRVVNWASSASMVLAQEYITATKTTRLDDELSALALRSMHTCLAAARAYAAAPWTVWASKFPEDRRRLSFNIFKTLPTLLAMSATSVAYSAVDHSTNNDMGLPGGPTVTVGIGLDLFATMDAITAANPDAFTDKTFSVLAKYATEAHPQVTMTFMTMMIIAVGVENSVGMAGYLTGPEPGLTAMLAVGRQAFSDVAFVSGIGSELQELADRAEKMEGVSEEVHKRRIRALATLPCARLGCTRVRQPGEVRQPAKKCSGCLTARFCSPSCIKADWKAHKIGCRAIAAEREAGSAAEAPPKAAPAAQTRSSGRSSFNLRF